MSSAQESAPKPSGKKTATSPAIRYPFWFGGSASSMAACVTHPLDLGTSLPASSEKAIAATSKTSFR